MGYLKDKFLAKALQHDGCSCYAVVAASDECELRQDEILKAYHTHSKARTANEYGFTDIPKAVWRNLPYLVGQAIRHRRIRAFVNSFSDYEFDLFFSRRPLHELHNRD